MPAVDSRFDRYKIAAQGIAWLCRTRQKGFAMRHLTVILFATERVLGADNQVSKMIDFFPGTWTQNQSKTKIADLPDLRFRRTA